jgi:hypothetical protein
VVLTDFSRFIETDFPKIAMFAPILEPMVGFFGKNSSEGA